MSEGYRIVSLAELERPDPLGDRRWSQIRRHFEIESFGVNAWVADAAGTEVINEHDEDSGEEELYVVLSGRATFTVDGETFDGPPGTVVFVRDPSAKRKAVVEEPNTRILAVGAKRGEAFVPMQWERLAPFFEHYENKDYDKAIEALEALLAENPDDGVALYNLACAKSLSGRSAEAIEHLRRSAALEERFREMARTDTDLDPIRDEPEFKAIVG
jgi:quercetin dioxygenase-like cupin family protein